MKGEFELIKELTALIPIDDKDVVAGFGDDCACVQVKGEFLLFTVDAQVENHHFIKDKISPEDLGWKLVSVNVSDVVACGGIPKWGLISIAIPKNLEQNWLKRLYRGIKKATGFYRFNIIGGNTSAAESIILDLSLTGITKRFVSRKAAKPKDMVFITGETGLSRAGLELLLMDKTDYEPFEYELIKKHTRPLARIDMQKIVEKSANACIDISDGLVGDLGHISDMSNVKIVIEKEKLPVHPLLEKFCKKYNKNPYNYILYGGEDYELIITSSHKLENAVLIGYVDTGTGIHLKENNKMIELPPKGFEHI